MPQRARQGLKLSPQQLNANVFRRRSGDGQARSCPLAMQNHLHQRRSNATNFVMALIAPYANAITAKAPSMVSGGAIPFDGRFATMRD